MKEDRLLEGLAGFHKNLMTVKAELDATRDVVDTLCKHVGLTHIEGQPLDEYYMARCAHHVQKQLFAIEDKLPELAAILQRLFNEMEDPPGS